MKRRICCRCKNELPATNEYFQKDRTKKDGLKHCCKECNKKHRQENKEKIAERNKKYRQENKEKRMEYNQRWREDNQDHVKAYYSQYHQMNKEKRLVAKKKWREENKGKISEYYKKYRRGNADKIKQYCEDNKEHLRCYHGEYQRKNKERVREWHHKRVTREKSLPNTLTNEQWEEKRKKFDYKCAYCGKKSLLHREHFIPISKGGGYTYSNILPACKFCNSSKKDRDFFKWYPQYEHYSHEREGKILEHLGLGCDNKK
ncbi:MAG: HNH endonuclease [Bacillota bacterium]|nr:HNH endonuclease [Bacillota bacterium]